MIRIDNVAIMTRETLRQAKKVRTYRVNWPALACIVIVAVFWGMLFWWITE